MSISFNLLCKHFSERIKGIYPNEELDISIIDSELLTEEKHTYQDNCIYIGKSSVFKGNTDKYRNACFILINDDSSMLEKYTASGLKIIELGQNEDPAEIYMETKSILRKNARYNQFKISLLDILLSGEGLHKIISTASKLIGNPLIVIDLSFKVLSSSPAEDITDPLWSDNVKKGYCSYEFIAELKKMEVIKRGRKTKRPFEVTCPESPNKKVVFRIEVEGKIIGNILLIECQKQITAEDYDYLVLISDIISRELGKKQFYKNTRNVMSEEILYDLLENNLENKVMIKERIKSAALTFSRHILVLAVDLSGFELKQSAYTRYLNSSLMDLFPVSSSIYYEDYIVIIFDMGPQGKKQSKFDRVRSFLSENKLKMGVSSEFSSIEDCSIYYHQAVASLEIGKILEPERVIFQYEDIQPYNFIYISKDKISKEAFFNSSLYALKDYDDKNNSKMYQTLYVYLKNNHSMTKTAEEMFIHRNTLRYRLEKISEIIGLDLDEDDNSFKLYYAYKSADFYKKLKSIQGAGE